MNDSLKVALAILLPGMITGAVFCVAIARPQLAAPSQPMTAPLPVRPPVPDRAAEGVLKKIEDVYLKADTISLSYQSDFCGEGPPQSTRGSCLLKSGAKIRFSSNVTRSARIGTERLLLVSDGKKLFSSAHPKVVLDLPQNLDPVIRLLVVRAGPGACGRLDALLFPEQDRGKPGDLYTTTVDEITFGPESGGLKSLRYWLHFSDPKNGFDMELWYDPATYRIVSYYDRGPRNVSDCDSRERILECTVGSTLSDEEFAVPGQ